MLSPGHILQNRYEIISKIDKGGMGIVYHALDKKLNSSVAVKETLFVDDNDLLVSFRHEAQLLANLRHPSLPHVIDYFHENDNHYLVMDFVPGEDLKKQLSKQGRGFPISKVLTWADQILDALTYMHEQEIPVIHRDIKPANLKLRDNTICLLDFGLAKGCAGEMSTVITKSSIFGYTAHYAPLEQIQGLKTTPQSDLYSLAATLYCLLTGVEPTDALQRATAIATGKPNPLKNINEILPSLDKRFADVVMKALSLDPNDRYASARAMRRALDFNQKTTFVVDVSDNAKGDHSKNTNGNRSSKNKFKLFAIAIVLLISLIAIGAYIFPTKPTAPQKKEATPHERAVELTRKAESLLQNNEYDAAMKTAMDAVRIDQSYGPAFAIYGDANWDMADDKAKRKSAERVLQLTGEPKTAEDYMARAWAHLAFAEEYDSDDKDNLAKEEAHKAVSEATESIKLRADYATAYMIRASAYSFVIDEFDLALKDFDKTISLKPNYAQAYSNRAAVYFKQKNYDKAISDYTKAIELKRFPRYFERRGDVYADKEEYERAIDDYSEAIKIYPKYRIAYRGRAFAYYKLKEYENAIQNYTKTIELNPKDATAFNGRGNAYADSGDFYNAIEDYTSAININPKFGYAYLNRAKVYYAIGRYDEAHDDADTAKNLGVEN